MKMKLYFNYSLDCELPKNTDYTGPERVPFFNGPATWDAGKDSVRGFVERMADLKAAKGTSLFVYPDVARHQKTLFREAAAAGVEIGLHLNGLRYSRLRGESAKWLGAMTRAEQLEALRQGKQDVEDAVGRPCLGYRACYGSANDDTFAILEELGFFWASNCGTRYRPEFHAKWAGSWRYPHRASRRCKLIPGDLRLYEIPVTCGLKTLFSTNPDQPLDLRAEASPELVGEKREKLRDVIAENLDEMDRQESPVRAIIGMSHNTNPFRDRRTHQSQNLDWVVQYTKALAAKHKLLFTPAPFATILTEALRVDAY
jgi:hypothetical protein